MIKVVYIFLHIWLILVSVGSCTQFDYVPYNKDIKVIGTFDDPNHKFIGLDEDKYTIIIDGEDSVKVDFYNIKGETICWKVTDGFYYWFVPKKDFPSWKMNGIYKIEKKDGVNTQNIEPSSASVIWVIICVAVICILVTSICTSMYSDILESLQLQEEMWDEDHKERMWKI